MIEDNKNKYDSHPTITGWLFDVYSLHDKIILWIKDTNGHTHRMEKDWSPSLYVASDQSTKLERILSNTMLKPFIKTITWAKRFEKVSDLTKTKVLKITVKSSSKLVMVARIIEQSEPYGVYRLYNVDVPPEQIYLYENDLLVLGKYKINLKQHHTNNERWIALDNIHDTDYELPEFSKVTPSKCCKICQPAKKITTVLR